MAEEEAWRKKSFLLLVTGKRRLNSSFKCVITDLVGSLGLSNMGVVASVSARSLSPSSASMHLRRLCFWPSGDHV